MGEKDMKLYWGQPTLKIGDTTIDPNVQQLALLTVAENDIKEDGHVFWNENNGYSLECEIKSVVIKTERKMFRYRLPRKFKKKIKNQMVKRIGLKVKKIRFNFTFFNIQKRRKRYEQMHFTKKKQRGNKEENC